MDKDKIKVLELTGGTELYNFASLVGIAEREMAKHIANFQEIPYIFHVDPGDMKPGILPPAFCKTNKVVPIDNGEGEVIFILSNPFNLELDDTLCRIKAAYRKAIMEDLGLKDKNNGDDGQRLL